MDMARTSLNLVGNCMATAVMARWDGSFAPPSEEPMITPHHVISVFDATAFTFPSDAA
jgi:Na+/H+-dicarboxylate symporter